MSGWYGESYSLDWGKVIAGSAWTDIYDVRLHYYKPDHHVFAAGDSVIIGSYADPDDWNAFVAYAEPIETRWVIEVRGGSGTLRLHAGVDPNWDYDNTALATQDLGVFAVAGPSTIVSPPLTVVDHSGLAAQNDAVIVWVECLTGSVDVKQVKMRVWPTAGVAGAWVDGPTWTQSRSASILGMVSGKFASSFDTPFTGMPVEVPATAAQAHAMDNLQAQSGVDVVAWGFNYGGHGSVGVSTIPFADGGTGEVVYYGASATYQDGIAYLSASEPLQFTPAPGVAGGVDPNEIALEGTVRSSAADPSQPRATFTGWTGSITGTHQGEDGFGVVSFITLTGPPPFVSVAQLFQKVWVYETGGAGATVPANGSASIPVFGGRDIAITARPSFWESWLSTGLEDGGGGAQVTTSSGSVSYTVAYSGYQYFDPLAIGAAVELFGDSTPNAGEYVYEGDVGAGGVPPILWFNYKKWGFLGQHFVAYGQGLGATQPALDGKFYLGPGDTYPVPADFRPPLVAWQLNAASDHAYDGSGVIFPGTDIAPPRVDSEVQTIEFIVPSDLVLTAPTEYHVYVVNVNGTSNALPFMLYPMVDVDMDGGEPLLMTAAAGMGEHGLDIPEDTPAFFASVSAAISAVPVPYLKQRYSRMQVPYQLTGRVPERAPAYLTSAQPAFTLTGGRLTNGLDDPVSVKLPMALRYRPLESKITARPDLGTDVSVWQSNESSPMDWRFNNATAPFVDTVNEISSRNGDLLRPAMVFAGNAWAESTTSFPAGPKVSVVMAVTVYPDAQARSYLLSSFVSGAPDPDAFPFGVYIEGDKIFFEVGVKQQVVRIARGYIGQRPIIVGLSMSSSLMQMAVVSDKATISQLSHPPLNSGGFKLYLGRCNDAGNLQMATMDILDMGVDNVTPPASPRLWSIINRLDGIYGVMK
jgi:hypothetical protein